MQIHHVQQVWLNMIDCIVIALSTLEISSFADDIFKRILMKVICRILMLELIFAEMHS